MCGYFEPQSTTCKIKHDTLQASLLAFLHLLSMTPTDSTDTYSTLLIPYCLAPWRNTILLLSMLSHHRWMLVFPLAPSLPLSSFFTSPQFSLFKLCIYPHVWRAVEHGIFLLQWKSCGQTNLDSRILNSIIVFQKDAILQIPHEIVYTLHVVNPLK